jgi:hypothetical protein
MPSAAPAGHPHHVVGEDVAHQSVDWLNDVERELTWHASFRSLMLHSARYADGCGGTVSADSVRPDGLPPIARLCSGRRWCSASVRTLPGSEQ